MSPIVSPSLQRVTRKSPKSRRLRAQERQQRHRRLLVEPLEDRRLLTSITWTGMCCPIWMNPSNWAPPQVPGSSDDVFINSAPFTATLTASTTVGSLAGSGPLDLSSYSLTVGTTNASATFAGVISGAGALIKVGAGVETLNGVSTYTGPTTVAAGTVRVNGSINSSSVTVLAGATLGGSGSSGPVTVMVGALHTPGTGPGSYTVSGSYVMNGALNAEFLDATGIPGTGHDQVRVSGGVLLAGSLNLAYTGGGSFNPAPGRVFTIIDNDSTDAVSGTFAGLAEGAAVTVSGTTLYISYKGGDGNDVVLQPGAVEVDQFPESVGQIQVELPAPTTVVSPSSALPSLEAVYVTPADVRATFHGTELEIILQDLRHRPFADPPPVITAVGADEVEAFQSSLRATAIVTSTAMGLNHAQIPVEFLGPVTTRVLGKSGAAAGTFDTEMVSMSLSGQIGSQTVLIRESPTQASGGSTSVTQSSGGGGGYMISSFFDIWVEISVDGGQSYIPADNAAYMQAQSAGIQTPNPELPPTDGVYRTPQQAFATFQTGPLQIVVQDIQLDQFTNVTRQTAGADEVEQFVSTVVTVATINGMGLENYLTPLAMTGPVETRVFGRATRQTGYFDTEMLELNLTGDVPLPDGTALPLRIRESPTKASLGRTSVRDLGNGTFHVDSFFDIWTELSLDGGQTWTPASNSTAVELTASPTVETVDLVGPTTVTVFFEGAEGRAVDDDDDGREEVATEMTQLDLRGMSSAGPVAVRLDPTRRTLGEIEERLNATPGMLDIGPFAPTGTADSFFDVFFDITVGEQVLHGATPAPMVAVISHKPPQAGERYATPPSTRVPLLDAAGNLTGAYVVRAVHQPAPTIEVDQFVETTALVQLVSDPQSPLRSPPFVLRGPAEVHVYFEGATEGNAFDDDGDGREEVVTQWVGMNLTDGNVTLRVRDVQQSPGLPSLGGIEEQTNATRGTLDLPPFTATGTADSFFDVFFEIELATGTVLHNEQPLHVQAVIDRKPPLARYMYVVPAGGPIELFDAAGNPAGLYVVRAEHYTSHVEVDVFPDSVGQIQVAVPAPTTVVTPSSALPPLEAMYVPTGDVFATFHGPGLEIVVQDARLRPFADPPPVITAVGADEQEIFQSSLRATAIVTGMGMDHAQIPVEFLGPVTTRVAGRAVETTGTFATEMLSMNLTGQIGGQTIRIRESPTRASGGSTSVTQSGGGGGGYMISSFFDIWVEISVDGGQSWIPADNAAYMQAQSVGIQTPRPELPPTDGVYRGPQDVATEFQTSGLQIGVQDVQLGQFTNVTRENAGADEVEHFDSTVVGVATLTGGGLEDYTTTVVLNGPVQTRVLGRATRQTGYFDTEMLELNLTGDVPLPDGTALPLRIRESPMKASLGRTAVRALGNGTFHVDSFFDIWTELSLDGGQTWTPASNSTAVELTRPPVLETVDVTGPTTVAVFFESAEGQALDDDGDGREEVATEMLQLDLHGTSSVGPVVVRLDSTRPTLGQIEEQANNTPGTLDVAPFTPTGLADSFFDVFFEIEVGGQVLHSASSAHMAAVISHKPPAPGETYVNPYTQLIALLDANGNPTGIYLVREVHTPNPVVPGSIHGIKYEDVDANSVYDPAIDRRLGGVTITLTGDADGDGTSETVPVTTDANGEYAFVGLYPGTYTVEETPPSGSVPTTAPKVTVTVGSGEELVAVPGQARITDPTDPRHEVPGEVGLARALGCQPMQPTDSYLMGELVRVFQTELQSMDLAGQGNMPLGSGFSDVLSQIAIRESPTRASRGAACVYDMGGDRFYVDSFFDVYFDITLTDIDPDANYAGKSNGAILPLMGIGPAEMRSTYVGPPSAENAQPAPFNFLPPPETAPYIGFTGIAIPLGDMDGDGDVDYLKFTLGTHQVDGQQRTFLQLPEGQVINSYGSSMDFSGAITDNAYDTPFTLRDLTGPAVASQQIVSLAFGNTTKMEADGEIVSKEPLLTMPGLPSTAGTDAFDSTAQLTIEIPVGVLGNTEVLTETVYLEGPTTVQRGAPNAVTGVAATEIVGMQLSGLSDLVGRLVGLPPGEKAPILVYENPDPNQASTGAIVPLPNPVDPNAFLARSYFEVKHLIQTPLGVVPGQVYLEATIDQIPPLGSNYVGAIDTAIVGPGGTVVARIVGRVSHQPHKPAIPVNTDVQFVIQTVVTNSGPLGPTDFRLTANAAAPQGCTIRLVGEIPLIEDLAVGEQRTVLETFTVSCTDPSQHHFQITNTITPLDPRVTDPDPSNNEMSTELRVAVIAEADGEIVSKEPLLTVRGLPATAGTDAFDSTAQLTIEVPVGVLGNTEVLTETVSLEGPTTVQRGAPNALTGWAATEILGMQLSGLSDLVGRLVGLPAGEKAPILVYEDPNQASTGAIVPVPNPVDPNAFLAQSYFDVKHLIQTPLGVVPGQVYLEATIAQIPPLGSNYVGAINTAIVGPNGTVVARIVGQVNHRPVKPAIPVNTDVEFVVQTVVHNAGPFGPADFYLTATALAPAGCTITPRGGIQVIEDLQVGEYRTVLETFTVNCSAPSQHHFQILNKLTPVDVHVWDRDLWDDLRSTELRVAVIAEADGEIVSFEVVDPPTEVLVGEPVEITLRKVVHNSGPFGPAEFDVIKLGVAPAGGSVTPTGRIETVLLPVSVPVEVLEIFTIELTEPGAHTFRFVNKIDPHDVHLVDSDLFNNLEYLDLTVIGLPTAYAFDFNTDTSPTQSGYVPVVPTDVYSAAWGYGWDTPLISSGASYQGAFDRDLPVPTPDPTHVALRRDGHWSQLVHTFRADLAAGNYQVTVTLGDASFPRDQMQITANGSVVTPAAGVSTAAGQWTVVTFPVTVGGAWPAVQLEFRDLGGDPYWVVNGLEIWPAPVGGVTFTSGPGLVPGDGVSVDPIMGTGPANTLLTVTTSLGTIVTDDSPAYAGTQVLTGAGGAFSIGIRRPVGGGGWAALTARAVDGSAAGSDSTLVGYTLAGMLFDFNYGSSPTATGYTGVAAGLGYTAARGYGWTTAATGFDRGAIGSPPVAESDLLRDGAYAGAAYASSTFQADVTAGNYQVTVTLGDAWFPRDRMQITANGSVVTPAGGVSTAAGQFAVVSFPLGVSGSAMQLQFSDLGGDPYWVANAVTIRPAVAAGVLTGPAGSLPADGTTLDTFRQTGLTNGDLYTVSTTLGTVVTADANPRYAGTQVAVAGGTLSFQVRRPLAAGTATVTAQEVTGKGRSSGTATYSAMNQRRFDFNTETSPTQAPALPPDPTGYIGVLPTVVYAANLGYGWDTPLISSGATYQGAVDRGLPVPTPDSTHVALRRDGHWSQVAHTFRADLAAGTYQVTVTLGDAWFPRDRMQITANGSVVTPAGGVSTAAGQWTVVTFPVTVGGAWPAVQLEFRDLGGDPYWVVNGLEIWPAPVGGVTFSGGPSLVPGDGSTVDTITGTGPANTLLTVSSSRGTILTDASLAYAGTQVLTGPSGAFSLSIRRPLGGVGWATVSARAVDGSAAGSDSTLVGYTFAGMLFDFNYGSSPTATGYTGVAAGLGYTAARGYGWTTAASGFDRGVLSGAPGEQSNLLRDGAYAGAAYASSTFQADVTAGNYQVTVTLGDAWFPRDRMQITANGSVVTPAGGVSTAAGQFAVVSFPLSVSGSAVLLQFSDLGGDPYWVANAVTIRPATPPGTLSGPGGSVPADGMTLDTFTQSGLNSGDLYTVSTTLGTVVTADANPRYAGTQVAVVGGTLSFQVRRPLGIGTATVTAQEVTGKGWSTGTTTYTVAPVRRFDFNGPGNFTATGFVGVRGGTTYAPTLGYGWSVATPEFERSVPTPLRRDGHYGAGAGGNTFTVLADSTKQYVVRVYVGDAWYPRDKIEVTVEGAAPYTIPSLAAGAFDTRATTAGLTAASDGKLTVTIKDLGGDPYWVINGIDVWATDATAPPGVQALRAGLSSQPSAVSDPLASVTLSSAQLAPIVEQAIGLWSATGLSASQVALLRSTPVVVGDLNAQGALGLAISERIVIDDDGAGRGWWYEGRSTKDDGQRTAYDLLTVVLHEMGHVLGHDHSEAADDLMAAVLQPGARRMPTVDAVFARW